VSRRIALLLSAVPLLAVTACAPRLARLPSDPGVPFPEYASAHAQATERCRDLKTMRAVLGVSGRAGRRLRASIDAGFEAPARVRLELPAPGKPIFIFVAKGESGTLLLPREERVLRDAPPADTLEALAGVRLGPEDLRRIVAGCGMLGQPPAGGRAFGEEWRAIDAHGATDWLQRVDGAWQLVAATDKVLEVHYTDFVGGRPQTIRLRAGRAGGASTDLTIRLSQVDVNEPIDAAVFEVDIPAGAAPMTLEELRQSGPLGKTE
jgi:hypothetical protein